MLNEIEDWFTKERIKKKYLRKRIPWRNKLDNYEGKNKHYSISKKLRKDSLIDDEFEFKLNNLKLEDLIGLKLELASRSFGNKLFGLPVIYSLKDIVEEAIVKYAYGASRSIKEAQSFIGVDTYRLYELFKKHSIRDYFETPDTTGED